MRPRPWLPWSSSSRAASASPEVGDGCRRGGTLRSPDGCLRRPTSRAGPRRARSEPHVSPRTPLPHGALRLETGGCPLPGASRLRAADRPGPAPQRPARALHPRIQSEVQALVSGCPARRPGLRGRVDLAGTRTGSRPCRGPEALLSGPPGSRPARRPPSRLGSRACRADVLAAGSPRGTGIRDRRADRTASARHLFAARSPPAGTHARRASAPGGGVDPRQRAPPGAVSRAGTIPQTTRRGTGLGGPRRRERSGTPDVRGDHPPSRVRASMWR